MNTSLGDRRVLFVVWQLASLDHLVDLEVADDRFSVEVALHVEVAFLRPLDESLLEHLRLFRLELCFEARDELEFEERKLRQVVPVSFQILGQFPEVFPGVRIGFDHVDNQRVELGIVAANLLKFGAEGFFGFGRVNHLQSADAADDHPQRVDVCLFGVVLDFD